MGNHADRCKNHYFFKKMLKLARNLAATDARYPDS
jgi:hypothetical protein